MTDSTDNGVTAGSGLKPSFEEQVQLKVQKQAEASESRNAWMARWRAASLDERNAAEERFQQAFSKIASQFGRSRRLVLSDAPTSDD